MITYFRVVKYFTRRQHGCCCAEQTIDVSDWDTTAAGLSVVTNAAGTNATGTVLSEVEEILFSRKWKRRCSFPAKSLGPISPTF